MATVHYGRLLGPIGFSRTVAIKRLHPHCAKDPDFVSMFVDEARLAARIQHPNVVQTLDVVAADGELLLVMEYVPGETLARLLRAMRNRFSYCPLSITAGIIAGVLYGLHAAHEATSERGEPLGIVHRDVSPQNVIVGTDGIARVLDFGVAKAAVRLQTTREGQLKGKLSYMAPEQLEGCAVTRRTDIYAASVVLWEALTMRRLFSGDNEAAILTRIGRGAVEPPSKLAPDVPAALDALVLRGLARNPLERFATAHEMAEALEEIVTVAAPRHVAAWLKQTATESLAARAEQVKEIESVSSSDVVLELDPDGQSTTRRISQPHVADSGLVRKGADLPEARAGVVSQPSIISVSASPASRAALASTRVRSVAIVLGIGVLGALGAYYGAHRARQSRIDANLSGRAIGTLQAPSALLLEPAVPSASPAGSTASPAVDLRRSVRVAVPAGASIEVDGEPAQAKLGFVEISGLVGSAHSVRARLGARETTLKVTVTRDGAVPDRIVLGANETPRPASRSASTTSTSSSAPPVTSNPPQTPSGFDQSFE